MAKKSRDLIRERKEQIIYILLYFFITFFVLKTVFGIISGSKCLLVSGVFALFGIFMASVTLLRISRSHPQRGRRVYFNSDKLEFVIILGISIIITLSTSSLLFSIGHMVLFHTLYPPEISAAWIALITGSLNLGLMVWIKKKMFDLPEIDVQEIMLVLNTDFLFSIMTIVTVVIARIGVSLLDYACAIFSAFFLIVYSVSFLFKAFKGLMDASCDKETVTSIEGLIRETQPPVILKTLRVNKVGHLLEIIITIGVIGDTSMREAATVVQNIRNTFRKKFLEPHELFVGVVQREQK